MTITVNPPETSSSQPTPRRPRRLVVALVAAAVLAAGGGIGIGLAVSTGGSSAGTTNPAVASSYAYYQSMMGRYGLGSGSMMGGSGYGWMMGNRGYNWMMGGTAAPGWMTGGSLPGFMMGANTDPGKVMGSLFADAPGPRVSPSQATALGNQAPAGATVDRSSDRITFTAKTVNFAVLASPAGGPDETFRIAGLVNPTIIVPQGAQLTIQVVNADPDTAHGLVVAGSSTASASWMPMMTSSPAFSGSALWFLGNPTAAGMHAGTLSFTASTMGTYRYLCPVPGHAQKGMVGALIVARSGL